MMNSFCFCMCFKSVYFAFIFEMYFPWAYGSRLSFFFQVFKDIATLFLAWIISKEKYAAVLIFVYLHIIGLPPHRCLTEFSVSLVLSVLIMICFGIVFFMLLVPGVHWTSRVCRLIVFLQFRTIPAITSYVLCFHPSLILFFFHFSSSRTLIFSSAVSNVLLIPTNVFLLLNTIVFISRSWVFFYILHVFI